MIRISLCVLQVAFIILQVCNVISWNWWVVFTPTYVLCLVVVLIATLKAIIEMKGGD